MATLPVSPALAALDGGSMAAWIIACGAVQASAPRLVQAGGGSVAQAVRWAGLLLPVRLLLIGLALRAGGPEAWLTGVRVAGLMAFGFVFAVNLSVLSCLLLKLTAAGRVMMDAAF